MEIIEEFVIDLQQSEKPPNTIKRYSREAQKFLEFVGKPYSAVKAPDIGAFFKHLRDKGAGKGTLQAYFAAIKAFYRFIDRKEGLDYDPTKSAVDYIRSFKTNANQNPKRVIALEEAKKLVNFYSDPMKRTLILLMLKTGARRGELLSAELENFDYERNVWNLPMDKFPKRTNLTLYFDEETDKQIHKWLRVRGARAKEGVNALFVNNQGLPISHNYVQETINTAARGIGLYNGESARWIDKFSSHGCRYFFTSMMTDCSDVPLKVVKHLRGDKGDIVQHYSPPSHKQIREAYDKAMPLFGI